MFILRNEVYNKIQPYLVDAATVGILTTGAGLLIKVALPQTNISSLATFAIVASLAKKLFEKNSNEKWLIEVVSGGIGMGACLAMGAQVYFPSVVALISLGMIVNLLDSNSAKFI